ncbi:MAG TPA: hypothetical protein VI320_12840 [Terracidiphilus sp.]|jgi:hypothetical protein
MKTTLRKSILAAAVVLATLGAVMPAHATISGSNPRPPARPASTIISVILAVLG